MRISTSLMPPMNVCFNSACHVTFYIKSLRYISKIIEKYNALSGKWQVSVNMIGNTELYILLIHLRWKRCQWNRIIRKTRSIDLSAVYSLSKNLINNLMKRHLITLRQIRLASIIHNVFLCWSKWSVCIIWNER